MAYEIFMVYLWNIYTYFIVPIPLDLPARRRWDLHRLHSSSPRPQRGSQTGASGAAWRLCRGMRGAKEEEVQTGIKTGRNDEMCCLVWCFMMFKVPLVCLFKVCCLFIDSSLMLLNAYKTIQWLALTWNYRQTPNNTQSNNTTHAHAVINNLGVTNHKW